MLKRVDEGVFEPRVHRSRIDLVSPGKLPNTPQPLKRGTVDNLTLPVVQADKTVYRASNLIRFVKGAHVSRRMIVQVEGENLAKNF
jgi:hypothetical protein